MQIEPMLLLFVEINAEPVVAHRDHAERRLKMEYEWKPGGHLGMPVVIFTGEAHEQQPIGHHADLPRVLEELHVDHRGVSLRHQLQQLVVQRLDAGLDHRDARIPHGLHLLAAQVCLGFVENFVRPSQFPEPGQHRFHVAHIDDVVRHADFPAEVRFREHLPLFEDPPGFLGTVVHSDAVKAAESAMALLPPPAPAGTLNR